ncbi:MAG: Uncharacterized protein Greene041619_908, partial [Candidatus Peregrinibacteria bacterium Greene0416_19]
MTNKLLRVTSALTLPFIAGIVVGTAVTSGVGAAMKGSGIFKDIPPGAYYDDAVGRLYGAGIVRGTDATHFGPAETINRAQIAVMLDRLRQELRGESSDDIPPPPPPPPPAPSAEAVSSERPVRPARSKK